MIAIRRVLCGSSVIIHRNSEGSWGGPGCDFPSSSAVGEVTVVLLGDLPSSKDSAPPK